MKKVDMLGFSHYILQILKKSLTFTWTGVGDFGNGAK